MNIFCSVKNNKQTDILFFIMIEFRMNHLFELSKDFVLTLLTFLFAEHGQRSFLVCRIDLIFFTYTHSLHTTMATAAHYVAHVFKVGNFVAG